MNLTLNNKPLKCVKKIKILGVFIEEKLNWKYHISTLTNKISRTSGILYNIGRSLPKTLRHSVFSSLLNSHISYCISVWGGNPTQLDKLFVAQKRALRALYRLKKAFKVNGIWKYGHTKQYFNDNFDERTDPRGRKYYWMTGEIIDNDKELRYDGFAVSNGYASITPIHFMMTNTIFLDELERSII